MTVSTTSNRDDYTGTGSVDTYEYNFQIFADTDLIVTQRDTSDVETTLVLNTDYTVTDAGDPDGGTVVLTSNLAANYVLTIRRVIALDQQTDIRNQGEYYPEIHEDQFDRTVMQIQQVNELVERSLQVPVSQSGVDSDLPQPSAGKALLWNDDADGIRNSLLSFDEFETDVLDTATNAANAATSASNAATSESNAATSESNAATSETNAASSAAAAATSESNASTSESNAATSETNAASSAAAAATSESNAATSETNAAASAAAAATSESNAATSETNAASSESNAVSSASAAATSEANAAASEAAAESAVTSAFYDTNVTKTADYTVLTGDDQTLFLVDTSGGDVTLTMPSIATIGNGARIGVFKTTSDSNSVIISPDGTDEVDNAASLTFSTQNSGYHLVANTGATPDNWEAVAIGQFLLDENSVTFSIMQDISTNKLIGRYNAGSGDPEEVGLASHLEFSGGNLQVKNGSLSLGKLGDIATNKLLGRSTAGSGPPETISIGAGLDLTSGTLTALTGTVVGQERGLVIKNGTTAASTMDIDADEVILKNASGLVHLAESVNLTADIASSGANGLDTGAEASDTWYYIWVIYDSTGDTVAGLLSASASSPTMPGTYDYKALVGMVRNDGSSDFRTTYIVNRRAWQEPVQVLDNTAAAVAGTFESLDISSAVPNEARACYGTVGKDTLSGTDVIAAVAGDSNGLGRTVLGSDRVGDGTLFGFGSGGSFTVPLPTAQTLYWTEDGGTVQMDVNGWIF